MHVCMNAYVYIQAKDFVAMGVILTVAFCLLTNVIDVDAETVAEGLDR